MTSRVVALVRDARIVSGASLRTIAHVAGCSHVYVSEIERGTRPCSARIALRLAEALGIDGDEMERAWIADREDQARAEIASARGEAR